MKVLISGGSGFLGTALSKQLLAHYQTKNSPIDITWLTRDTQQAHLHEVTLMSYDALKDTDTAFDVVINLAGAGIADKRWSDERKQQLMDSRIKPTQALLNFIERSEHKPKCVISGSAIGWYGTQGDRPLTEDSGFEDDFAHRLCAAWEQLAAKATEFGVPVALIRTGVVIHPSGGMLGKLLTPFKMGLGGQLGDGTQIMSWISRDDWVSALIFVLEQQLAKATSAAIDTPKVTIYNFTAPNPVSNAVFTKAVGHWLHRPTLFTLPRPLLKVMFGEMATLLVDGQKVLPKALEDSGYTFVQPTLAEALRQQKKR
ncbi:MULTISPECIES: TIGR01777 family oxidoreductase [unclassified Psychrobacter]|uniref:TIGR01777 family oxidoreductase n=1 Tax=unclassified Psychrobacter TaxID=196806 RepID=UPI0018F370DE|nr:MULTISPECIES: TIGR01777 family oxidoreductase [unclassified Psychrobacter]